VLTGGGDSSILGEFWLPCFIQGMVERFPIFVEGESALPVYVAGVLLDLSLLLQADQCAWIFWAGCWCMYCQFQCCVLAQPVCLVGTVRYGTFRKPVIMEKQLWVFFTVLHL